MVLVNSVFNLVSVVSDQALNGPGSSITQSTNSMSLDLFSQLPQHVNFSIVCLSDLHSFESICQPRGTLSTWSTLSTTLMLVKLAQPQDRLDDVS